jgi:hypothetical protein
MVTRGWVAEFESRRRFSVISGCGVRSEDEMQELRSRCQNSILNLKVKGKLVWNMVISRNKTKEQRCKENVEEGDCKWFVSRDH